MVRELEGQPAYEFQNEVVQRSQHSKGQETSRVHHKVFGVYAKGYVHEIQRACLFKLKNLTVEVLCIKNVNLSN